jgi:hypothetical protein
MHPLLSRLFCLALGLGVALLPVMPPEHVHDVRTPDGHHHALVHRHVSVHSVRHPQQPTRLDDVDPVQTLESAFITTAVVTAPAPALRVAWTVQTPLFGIDSARTEFVERVIHGPPRFPAALRAPPSLRLT